MAPKRTGNKCLLPQIELRENIYWVCFLTFSESRNVKKPESFISLSSTVSVYEVGSVEDWDQVPSSKIVFKGKFVIGSALYRFQHIEM